MVSSNHFAVEVTSFMGAVLLLLDAMMCLLASVAV